MVNVHLTVMCWVSLTLLATGHTVLHLLKYCATKTTQNVEELSASELSPDLMPPSGVELLRT